MTSIAPLIERARALQRLIREQARAAFRSAPVPFVPNAAPQGWSDALGEEIAAEFLALMPGSDALEEAYLRRQARESSIWRENRRLDGVARRREPSVSRRTAAGRLTRPE